MPHNHSHAADHLSDRRLVAAMSLNLALALAEAIAGLWAGSLALVADALHNLSDVGSLAIALAARRIGRWPSDERRTFGYRRAEVIGALINLTILVVIGIYLAYEAVVRFFQPQIVEGWIVVIVATMALAVNVATVVLLRAPARGSLNVQAAYLHNVQDSLSSLGVILAGAMILLWAAYWTDSLITLTISGFILWQSISTMAQSIRILMESAPADVDSEALVAGLQSLEGVIDVHHLHLWEIDEHHRALEAHIVVDDAHLARWAEIKQEVKQQLGERFNIHHSTLEFERADEQACQPCPPGGGEHC